MGKSTISMAIFNSYVSLPEGRFLTYPSINGSFSIAAISYVNHMDFNHRLAFEPKKARPLGAQDRLI